MGYTHKLVGRRLVYTIVVLQLLVAFATIPMVTAEEEEGLPPIPDAGGPYEGDEGEELIFDASASVDPDGNMLFFRWNFEGTWTDWTQTNWTYYTFYDDFAGTITVEVSDGSFFVTATADVLIHNVAPSVYFDFEPFIPANVNLEIELTGEFFDPDPRSHANDTHTALFEWGDGTNTTVLLTLGDRLITETHIYNQIGIYEAKLTISDDDGGSGNATCLILVNGVDAGPDVTIFEGETYSSLGSFLILFGTVSEGFVDYGDGSDIEQLTLSEEDTFELNHIYLDDGLYEVMVILGDPIEGVAGIGTVLITVENIAPTINIITGPTDPIPVGTSVSLSCEFTDPGVLDSHTAIIDWGDENTTIVDIPLGDRILTDSYSYQNAGVYTVNITIIDDDGDWDTAIFQYIVAYDADGGFVTGGGWINSPEGAYKPDITISGKASFGFVSKYKKGQTTPSGNTQFQFKTGNINFHSSNYDWLIIAGSKAMYKGTGTINGDGNYGFMLSAIDGQLKGDDVDKFRIKIWDKNTDEIIYDNNIEGDDLADPATALGGGQIVIHKK